MKSKTKKYSIFFVVMVMVLVSTLAVKVKAADPTTGSLTIVAKEQQNNTTNNDPLKGVEYTLYKVDETVETTTQAESYITSNSVTGTAKTTGEDGQVEFVDLTVGKYKITEIKAPEGYELSKSDIEVEITKEQRELSLTATNVLKLELPETGSINNTIIIAIVGIAVMVISTVGLKLKKKTK